MYKRRDYKMNLLNYKPHNDLKILKSDYENVFFAT